MHSTASPDAVSKLAAKMPKGTWCSHMHIVDPNTYPLSSDANYTPAAHTMKQARAFFDPLGIEKMVIVQPSIYGNNNDCTLSGLPDLGSMNGRAVIQFDPDVTSADQIKTWHEQGVRGVRLNFKSVGAKITQAELEVQLHKYAAAVGPLGWVLELYIAMEDIPLLAPLIPSLNDTKLCIDHLGHPSSSALESAKQASELPGWDAFTKILKQPNVWCKLSATYRLSKNPKDPLVADMCKGILQATKGERCVFATDWPHTRFEDVDVVPFLEAIIEWIEEAGVSTEKILVNNADVLWR